MEYDKALKHLQQRMKELGYNTDTQIAALAADKTLENYPILCYAFIGFSIERHSEMKLHQMIVRCHTITPA